MSGCVGVSSKGIFGTGVSVALDPRSLGTQIDDSIMQKNLSARLVIMDKKYFLSIKSKVLDGRIFLTGKVDNPEEKLKITKFTQPAIFIVSTIISHLLLEKGYKPDGVAGHSLGEYSALVAAKGIDYETGLELVKVRSNSMDNAGKLIPGTMAAVIGMDRARVKKLTQKLSSEQIVVAANYNTENLIVISGNIDMIFL